MEAELPILAAPRREARRDHRGWCPRHLHTRQMCRPLSECQNHQLHLHCRRRGSELVEAEPLMPRASCRKAAQWRGCQHAVHIRPPTVWQGI